MSDEIKKFLNLIEPYTKTYKSIDIRVVAYCFKNSWLNLGTKILLDVTPQKRLSVIQNLPKLTNFIALHEIKPFSDLDTMLNSLSQGKLTINGYEILYGRIDQGEIKFQGLNCRIYERGAAPYFYKNDFKFTYLHDSGESIQSIVKDRTELDNSLRSLEHPYDGMDDLTRNFLLTDRGFSMSDYTYLYVIAPSYLRFTDKCIIEKGKLILDIEFLQKELKPLKLGIIQHTTEDSIKRYSLKPDQFRIKRRKQKLILTRKVDDCRIIENFLVFNSDVADKFTLYNIGQDASNRILKIHDHFDPQFQILKKYLSGEGKSRSQDFESGVAMLLSLIGFITYPYGIFTKEREVPDGVAFIPESRKALIYECTLGLPDANDKLSKLSLRTKKLKDFLDDFELVSVIFTAMEYDKIPGKERREAGGEMISLISVEYIEEILNMFIEGKSIKKNLQLYRWFDTPCTNFNSNKKIKRALLNIVCRPSLYQVGITSLSTNESQKRMKVIKWAN